eukprot:GHVO01047899.1.p1 GENE.GHVO01047899.1~~GHVO01047899.1.p1  ORF type:complete len:490 (+),score=83.21 GHVO01047899.1:199-1470(+)
MDEFKEVNHMEPQRDEKFTRECIHRNFSNWSAWTVRHKLQLNVDVEMENLQEALFTEPRDQSSWLSMEWFCLHADIHRPLLAAIHAAKECESLILYFCDACAIKEGIPIGNTNPQYSHVWSINKAHDVTLTIRLPTESAWRTINLKIVPSTTRKGFWDVQSPKQISLETDLPRNKSAGDLVAVLNKTNELIECLEEDEKKQALIFMNRIYERLCLLKLRSSPTDGLYNINDDWISSYSLLAAIDPPRRTFYGDGKSNAVALKRIIDHQQHTQADSKATQENPLDLSHCGLRRLNRMLCTALIGYTVLDLGYNNFRDSTSFVHDPLMVPCLYNVSHLDIRANQIKSISDLLRVFKRMPNLKIVNLEDNEDLHASGEEEECNVEILRIRNTPLILQLMREEPSAAWLLKTHLLSDSDQTLIKKST